MIQNNRTTDIGAAPHVLVVDDDERIRNLLNRYLTEEGFVVVGAENAQQARDVLGAFSFDIIVLDIMMPGETGYEFLEQYRQDHATPVLFLSAMGDVDDRVKGLELGADDFLPKPFEPKELVLRLQMILKRTLKSADLPQALKIGRWTYNATDKALISQDETIKLTDGENNLLRALASKQGAVISREELAEMCQLDAGERTIDVQVTRLRRKLEDDPKFPIYLQTVRGKGYVLKGGV